MWKEDIRRLNVIIDIENCLVNIRERGEVHNLVSDMTTRFDTVIKPPKSRTIHRPERYRHTGLPSSVRIMDQG